MKYLFTLFILCFVLLSFTTACSQAETQATPEPVPSATPQKAAADTSNTKAAKPAVVTIPDTVIVYYFHGDYRCKTCTTMEQLADQTIKETFAEELKSGKLQWKVVNTDREENKHFTQDYQLFTKSLVLSAIKDGKQIKWKNCDKIWEHVHHPPDYIAYVAAEIRNYLDGV